MQCLNLFETWHDRLWNMTWPSLKHDMPSFEHHLNLIVYVLVSLNSNPISVWYITFKRWHHGQNRFRNSRCTPCNTHNCRRCLDLRLYGGYNANWWVETANGFPPQMGANAPRKPTLRLGSRRQRPMGGQRVCVQRAQAVVRVDTTCLMGFGCKKTALIAFGVCVIWFESHLKLWYVL